MQEKVIPQSIWHQLKDAFIGSTKTVLSAPLLAAGMDEPSWQEARGHCQDDRDSLQCGRRLSQREAHRVGGAGEGAKIAEALEIDKGRCLTMRHLRPLPKGARL
jgi:hypothetical protein